MYNDNLDERYALAIDRIREIAGGSDRLPDYVQEYFTRTANFVLQMDEI